MAKRQPRWQVLEDKGKARRFARKADALRHARRRARSTGRVQLVLDTLAR